MSAAAARRHEFHPLAVAAVEPLTDDAVAVTFTVPPQLRERFRFTAGQHLTVRAVLDGEEVRRSYSICAPAPDGPLRVAVKRLDGGAFSRWATTSLRPGDVLDVMTPAGRFSVPLDPALARHHCFLAAGSGITPVLSLLETTLREEPRSRCTLVYGNRSAASVMFLDELADLKDRYPVRLRLLHVLSREQQEVPVLSGRLDDGKVRELTAGLLPVGTVDEWYLCGPFAMVEQVRSTLLDLGVAQASVHVELFHVAGEAPREARAAPDGRAAADHRSEVTVRLDGRSSLLSVPQGTSVLDALLPVRPDAPYACRGGVCGTCRARVISGDVDVSRSYALDPEEVAAGFVLTCSARPVSAQVVLDFDA